MADDFSSEPRGGSFPATRRSAVVAVASDDPAERARSFDILVRAYWKPVYKYVRVHWNRASEDARDLTQGFFSRALEKSYFARYDAQKALFRTYLKMCLDRFVMEHARDERRQKRGGAAVRLSLDFDVADEELARLGPAHAGGADAYFEAEWIRHLLATSVDALDQSCAAQGKPSYFAAFRRYVLDPDRADEGPAQRPSYASVARELGLSVSEVTNYLAWTRREFRKIVIEKLRELTATEEEFRSEVRAVLGADP
jgi:DNA-directed RNA polymerase specialized sigma24 family protein